MQRLNMRLFVALFMLVSFQSFAQDPVSPASEDVVRNEVNISINDAKVQEVARRNLIEQHIAWQWLMGVRVASRGKEDITGLLVGMEGEMLPELFTPSGTARTLAWMTQEGKLIWASSILTNKDGSVLHRFRQGEAAWQEDPEQLKILSAMQNTLGMQLSYEDLKNWLTGIPGGKNWPKRFVQSEQGIYPVHANLPKGTIEWSAWRAVETEKGVKMPMPGAWEVSLSSQRLNFTLVSFEGYAADELPAPSWPYMAEKQDSWLKEKEEPIVPDDELDYQQW